MNMDSMSIGKVANRVAVGVETLRFYEREGLLEKPPRLSSGYRAYPAATVNRVLFIKRAKGLGFRSRKSKSCWPCGSLLAQPAGMSRSAPKPR
jgi:DNA-binding transcriptional MerR regulator